MIEIIIDIAFYTLSNIVNYLDGLSYKQYITISVYVALISIALISIIYEIIRKTDFDLRDFLPIILGSIIIGLFWACLLIITYFIIFASAFITTGLIVYLLITLSVKLIKLILITIQKQKAITR